MWTIVDNRLQFTPRAVQPMSYDITLFANDQWEAPFCQVCSRSTDHFAEHDDLVDLGQARYTSFGDVLTTLYFYTVAAQQERRVLNDAWDYLIDRSINVGPVCLVKPVGEALTFRYLSDLGQSLSPSAWVHRYSDPFARL